MDAVDKDGKQMIAALSPSKNGGRYHLITSFYGRSNIDKMTGNVFKGGKFAILKTKK